MQFRFPENRRIYKYDERKEKHNICSCVIGVTTVIFLFKLNIWKNVLRNHEKKIMEMLKPLLCKIRNCTKIYLLQATRVTYFFSNVATVISRMNPQRKHFIVKITRLWGTLYLRNSVCDLKLFVFLTIRIYTLYLMVHY